MKVLFIMIISLIGSELSDQTKDEQQLRKRSDWFEHIDQRLTKLEKQLESDLILAHQQQQLLNEEMHQLNNKLENRFDKYFLWGDGTLLVIISTLVSVIFNKQRLTSKSKDPGQEKRVNGM